MTEDQPAPNQPNPAIAKLLAPVGGMEGAIHLLQQFFLSNEEHNALTKAALLDMSARLRKMEAKLDALQK